MKAKLVLFFILLYCGNISNGQSDDTAILTYVNNFRDSLGIKHLEVKPNYLKASFTIAKFVSKSLHVSILDSIKTIMNDRTGVWERNENKDSFKLYYYGSSPHLEEPQVYLLYTMLIAESKTNINSINFDFCVYNIWFLSDDYHKLFANPNVLFFAACSRVTKEMDTSMFYSIFEVTGIMYVK